MAHKNALSAAAHTRCSDLKHSQPSLFDAELADTLLADDERGRILYVPRFVDRETADAWFAALRDELMK